MVTATATTNGTEPAIHSKEWTNCVGGIKIKVEANHKIRHDD